MKIQEEYVAPVDWFVLTCDCALLVCSKFCFWRWCPSLQDRFWYLLRPPLHLLLLKLLLLAALLNQCAGLIFPNKFSNMPCQISTPVSALLLARHIC